MNNCSKEEQEEEQQQPLLDDGEHSILIFENFQYIAHLDNHGSMDENHYKQSGSQIQVDMWKNKNTDADIREETKVTVNLVDCMKCFIQIPRCQVKIKEQNHSWKIDTPTRIDQQIQELHEEEEEEEEEKKD